MGSSGFGYFCKNGHLTGWVEEHLYLDDAMWEEHKKNKTKVCPCGAPTILTITHYGGLNDCICLDDEIPEKGIVPLYQFDEVRVEIQNVFEDKDGKPITAYRKDKLRGYRIPEDVISGKRFEA